MLFTISVKIEYEEFGGENIITCRTQYAQKAAHTPFDESNRNILNFKIAGIILSTSEPK